MIQVYHNPRCGKSRDCLAFLDNAAVSYQTIDYLNDAPTYEVLRELVRKLGLKPIDLVRQKEPLRKEKFAGKKMAPAQLLRAMSKHPVLIERPIVINGDKAVIARPVEHAMDILDGSFNKPL